MELTRNTSDQFILENKPWVLPGIMIFGTVAFLAWAVFGQAWALLVAAGMCFLIFVLSARRSMVMFDAGAGQLEIRHRTVFGLRVERFDLDDIIEAFVETSNKGDSPTARVVMRLKPDKRVPLNSVLDNRSAQHHLNAKRINNWLADRRAAPE